MAIASLFSGIGGLELGLHAHGFVTEVFCDNDLGSQSVLEERFPGVPISLDVRELHELPNTVDFVTAGFPCQDLSQAGRTRGIDGAQSGLVNSLFRILEGNQVPNVLIENVPFMLQLNRGQAIQYVVQSLENLGYNWAYRVIDANCFGIPQRRERVYLFASLEMEPQRLLYQGDFPEFGQDYQYGTPCGFYWTEGKRGLGWAINGVPTIKGGSGVGIASPPAIWVPEQGIFSIDIRDAERLQGFPADWTMPSERVFKRGHRWRLVGNAVSTAVSDWIGGNLNNYQQLETANLEFVQFEVDRSWPAAAFGGPGAEPLKAEISMYPVNVPTEPLLEFLEFPMAPLSHRATSGFFRRLTEGTLRHPPEFARDLNMHIQNLENIRNAR